MKIITIVLFLFSTLGVLAQDSSEQDLRAEIKLLQERIQSLENNLETAIQPLEDRISALQSKNTELRNSIEVLNAKALNTGVAVDSLQRQAETNRGLIANAREDLAEQIQQTGKTNEEKIIAVDQSLSKNSLYGIIGFLSVMLLSGVLYWLLSKRQKTDKSALIEQLSKTKSSIEASLVTEFGKQTELMDAQLQIIEKQKSTGPVASDTAPDHSLALKLASEINLIERNISLMDANTRGLKQLKRSVGKLKDNLAANGYEMPELLGKQFDQGLKAVVISTIPDENLEKGTEIITKVLIPQVNYNDKMIQTAQIEVSVGG